MAKTNLLRPLATQTGEFYMFSQYAEDLTKENSQKTLYKVVPSRFAAIEINPALLYQMAESRLEEDVNVSVCRYLQNSYENSCAFFRDILVDGNHIWTNFMASRLLWQNLFMYKFAHMESIEGEGRVPLLTCPEIKYIGDINIYTNKTYDGVCYNEIYCYIPTNAKERRYIMTCTDENGEPYTSSESYNYSGSTLIGWDSNNYPANLTTAGVLNVPLFGYSDDATPEPRVNAYTIMDGNWYYPQALSHSADEMNDSAAYTETEAESFNINSIIVFYDIYQGDNCIYRNLPLGMYFTGTFNNNSENPEFSNTIKKFVNNNDVFGQGTSYGLRILTKHVCTPNSLYFIESVLEIDDMYPEYAELMSKMSESLIEMDKVVETNRSFHQDIKDHLAYFKNYRTNVPYLRNVNGVPYWFVNGRNTGQAAVMNADSLVPVYAEFERRLSVLEQTGVQYG